MTSEIMLKNEFDTEEDRTNNYNQHQALLQRTLCIADVVKLLDFITTLPPLKKILNWHWMEYDVANEYADILEPFKEFADKAMTNETCPHCGKNLYLSDLPQYDYVCVYCDENF